MSRTQLWLGGLCLLCALILVATALPAPFTIDDCNYLSSVAGLREGTLFLPGTAGLPPSRALYAFNPNAVNLANPVTPVPPYVPPLYALVAYPFSFLGWTGLVFLNVLACLATVLLVFAAARRLTGQAWVGIAAALLWFFGASTIEYAQGLWPHMLAVALTTAGLVLTAMSVTSGRAREAAAAGCLLALAAGMRYQNAVLLGCGLLVLLFWGVSRLRTGFAFSAGALPLVLLSAFINHARIGVFHPFTKAARYTSIGAGRGRSGGHALSPAHDFLLSLWTKVVDYSATPPLPGHAEHFLTKQPAGDMVTLWGVLKKSWLQASPWLAVALLVLVLAWSRRDRIGEPARRHLRMLALPMLAVLVVFGLGGTFRHDGLTFNQRYFLELAPLAAIAAAVGLHAMDPRWPWLAGGTALGTAAAAAVLLLASGPLRYRWQSILPLVMAGLAVATWLVALVKTRWRGPAGLALAMCLGYSLAVHLATDVPASRQARYFNLGREALLEEAVTPDRPAAVVAATGPADAFCPLLLDHDLVVADGNVVPASALPPLIDALLAKRRVLLWLETFPKESLALLRTRYHLTMLRPPMLVEIGK